MPIEHVVLEPTDRFATLDRHGQVRTWEVLLDGGLYLVRPDRDDQEHDQA